MVISALRYEVFSGQCALEYRTGINLSRVVLERGLVDRAGVGSNPEQAKVSKRIQSHASRADAFRQNVLFYAATIEANLRADNIAS